MKADKNSVTRLLKTAKGQLEGILKMVEEDRYCVDISNQILATQAILNKANKEILRSHIKCCVKNALESDNETEKDKKIEEMLTLLDKMGK
ncbi:metal-sensing transcriptional repressor [Anaerovorax sp. IOR16]|uniref:metal-sensing transcriptional repressor n=1 Tax=Anaerovorax sp. IOR16 TaxID=2773458 RepID=UPI0019D1B901|nr:metal-sensing transcriptional repressor [Anaerovorax sp. IOR16]